MYVYGGDKKCMDAHDTYLWIADDGKVEFPAHIPNNGIVVN